MIKLYRLSDPDVIIENPVMSATYSIDALDFARNARACHGRIPLSKLERLQDYLIENLGELQYEVRGGRNDNGKPALQVSVQGLLKLRCQRCLGELEHIVDVKTDLLLAENEKELSSLDEDESVEGILAEPDLDVLALVEDEVILGLPISPRHDECECSDNAEHETEGEKPFAALAALKKLH